MFVRRGMVAAMVRFKTAIVTAIGRRQSTSGEAPNLSAKELRYGCNGRTRAKRDIEAIMIKFSTFHTFITSFTTLGTSWASLHVHSTHQALTKLLISR